MAWVTNNLHLNNLHKGSFLEEHSLTLLQPSKQLQLLPVPVMKFPLLHYAPHIIFVNNFVEEYQEWSQLCSGPPWCSNKVPLIQSGNNINTFESWSFSMKWPVSVSVVSLFHRSPVVSLNKTPLYFQIISACILRLLIPVPQDFQPFWTTSF